MARKLISEQTVIETARRGETSIVIEKGMIVTDAAKDRALQMGITMGMKNVSVQKEPMAATGSSLIQGLKETIAIGSDHGGFQMKSILKSMLESLGHKVIDVGTYSEESCDYPDFAYAVARMVSMGEAT